ncbi:alpha/beta hydrolase family protein [Wenzhouxiangella sp. EGI_FJ10409]|uniref:alpha/beta hydrolase family protein n=1 Tax=Wenzhouxiangella sp. EGI_FJ10409 TaxID=3243767 RepID=UPI0035D5F686
MPYRLRIAALTVLVALLYLPLVAAETIPTRQFVDHSDIRDMRISPDGKHVALTYEEGTQVKLATMALEDMDIIASFEFGENQHVLQFWWGSNERLVMSVGEVTGNLDNTGRAQQLYAADLDGQKRREIFDTSVRGAYQMLHPLPDDDRRILLARYHGADRGEPRPIHIDMYDGELRPAGGLPVDNDIVALVADNDGNLRGAAALEWGDSLDDREFRLHVRHEDEWRQVQLQPERPSATVDFLGFSSDNDQVYFSSNHDMPEDDRLGVFRYDFNSGETELLYRHEDMDVSGLIRGPGGEILGASTRFGPMNYHLFDDKVEDQKRSVQIISGLVQAFPGNDVTLTSASEDGERAIVWVRGDRNPGEFYLLETETMEMRFLMAALPDLPKDALVSMKPVTIEARDGLELHAMLTLPKEQEEDLPLIVNVHGGPFGIVDRWSYNMEAQLMAHHGYATLQVNYRGSGGRGDDFQQAGWKEWGGKMQDDVTDATHWAIEQGIADADRICIYGGSYGGYASLMGVIKEPDLYQCAVGYVGVYDLPWFRSGDGNDFSRNKGGGREARAAFERFMSTAVGNDEERLRQNSPVHNVDRIEADLYLVHGGSDVRVVIGHMERLQEALDEAGKDYESMVKEDEGHGFYDVDNRVDFYDSMLEFLDRNIGPEASDGKASADP